MAQDPGEVTLAADPEAAVAVPESTPETERLRAQIEETRAEMSETLDAIQDRLRPGRLAADAKESVKEATVGRVRDLTMRAGDTAGRVAAQSFDTSAAMMDTVRRNPVPAVLIGASAGLVFVYALRRRARSRREAESELLFDCEALPIP
jgi:ElaB/YqjD/DUF883 family membrane-anchored ribosome-binding protein